MTSWGLIVFESSLTRCWSDLDRIRIRVVKYSQGHLGASCSNIGRIRTKENIAVSTHLIGAMPKLMVTWGLPDRIRIIALNIPLDRCNAKTYGHLGAS